MVQVSVRVFVCPGSQKTESLQARPVYNKIRQERGGGGRGMYYPPSAYDGFWGLLYYVVLLFYLFVKSRKVSS